LRRSVLFDPRHARVAQDRSQTLADIRQELSVLFVELQRLGQELNTTGGASGTGASGSMLQRMDALEAEIRRLAALTEDLQIRVDSVVRDGTNRVGDLEFRLCELEPDCDIGSLGETPNLGGVEPSGAAPGISVTPDTGSGPQLAVAEQDDFDRARAAFEAGDYAAASAALTAFTQTYPGGPLSAQAHFLRGEAEARQTRGVPQRVPISTAFPPPDGEIAPAALTALGRALGRLGQVEEACLTLQEVAVRYPGDAAVAAAEAERFNLGCS
jgi:TolA-binding protein